VSAGKTSTSTEMFGKQDIEAWIEAMVKEIIRVGLEGIPTTLETMNGVHGRSV